VLLTVKAQSLLCNVLCEFRDNRFPLGSSGFSVVGNDPLSGTLCEFRENGFRVFPQ